MTETEWQAFITEGTRTGKLGVVRPDGRPLVVPIWFILESDPDHRLGVIRFQTGGSSAKVRSMRVEPRVCLTVDDERPPFSFAMIEATANVRDGAPHDEMYRIAAACGERYMGTDRAEEFAARNAVPGEVVVDLIIDRVIAWHGVSA